MTQLHAFASYLQRWHVDALGQPWATPTSDLLHVRLTGTDEGVEAVLKVPRDGQAPHGAQVLQWWGGEGAARVYACDTVTGAVLMERAAGSKHLLRMVLDGEDDAATRSMCQTIAQLHANTGVLVRPQLPSLQTFFQSLWEMAPREGGLMAACVQVAAGLLQDAHAPVVLHADTHHGNILDFGAPGWLAIDPKGAVGECTYDYVQVLCNPELPTAAEPARFARQLAVLLEATGLDKERVLRWVMAHAGLSAAWFREDGLHEQAQRQLAVAHLAQQTLGLRPK